jgi:hypothetical protein
MRSEKGLGCTHIGMTERIAAACEDAPGGAQPMSGASWSPWDVGLAENSE